MVFAELAPRGGVEGGPSPLGLTVFGELAPRRGVEGGSSPLGLTLFAELAPRRGVEGGSSPLGLTGSSPLGLGQVLVMRRRPAIGPRPVAPPQGFSRNRCTGTGCPPAPRGSRRPSGARPRAAGHARRSVARACRTRTAPRPPRRTPAARGAGRRRWPGPRP